MLLLVLHYINVLFKAKFKFCFHGTIYFCMLLVLCALLENPDKRCIFVPIQSYHHKMQEGGN